MPDVKNILFDYGGVICDLQIERCIQAFMQLGCRAELFRGDFFLYGIFQRIDRGTATEEEFYDEIRRLGGIPNATDKEIYQAWSLFLKGVPAERYERLVELSQRFGLYLLSNGNAMHWRYICRHLMTWQGHDILKCFRGTYVSYQLHLEKPEQEIYLEVARRACIRPEETLFIDDHEQNLTGAAGAGFQTRLSTDGDWVRWFL